MRGRIIAASFLAALGTISPSWADNAQLKGKVEEEIKLQDARAQELDVVGRADETWSRDLAVQVKNLDAHAVRMEATAKHFRDSAATMKDANLQKELNGFAAQMDAYSNYDRQLAKGRQKVADELIAEARRALAGAKNHRDNSAKLKAFLARLK
jgi:hypothetical protein